jgi:ABC-type transport auxiliary lipoprotein component
MTGRRAWIGLSLALLAVGCGTPPKEYFYTLSDYTSGDYTLGDLATGDAGGSNYSVAIAPVSVPEDVDRPQMVVRAGGHRVEMSELHRWAEPLKSEIPRVLAVHLRIRARASTPITGSRSTCSASSLSWVSGSRSRRSGACVPHKAAEPAPAGPSSPSRREAPTTKRWPRPMAGRSHRWQASWPGRSARCDRQGRCPEHGDRGVGKSFLAQTAAHQYQSAGRY